MILELKELTVRYGRFTALENLNLHFEGGALGLLGPNGAGKSTLLRTILGMVKPAAGEGFVLGQNIKTGGLSIRQGIGYMPERDCFIPAMSAVRSLQYLAELSGLPYTAARKRAHEVAYFVGLGDERYRPVDSYSTGMKQKFKFGQAIVHDPKLIFLDEPTNGLDPTAHMQMIDLIREISSQKGLHIIYSTHLLPDVESTCDQVAVLEKGKLRKQGSIEELRGKSQGTFMVRILGEAEKFQARARELGLMVDSGNGETLTIVNPEGEETHAIFRAAADTQSYITEIREKRRSLQEVFLESLDK